LKKIIGNDWFARSFIAFSLTCLGLVMAPGTASGAACCVSATSFGVGRLTIWEDFAVGLRMGHTFIIGQWEAGGSFVKNGADYSEGITFFEPYIIARIHERVQAQGWFPVLVNDRTSSGESQVVAGLGDWGGAFRFEILSIGEYYGVPALAVTLGGLVPTGRRVEQTMPPLFAGVTGRGAWAGFIALETEYSIPPWFVRLDMAATGFLPFTRTDSGQTQQFGPLLQAALSSGAEVIPDKLVLAAAFSSEWEDSFQLNGVVIPSSTAYSLGLSISVSWRFDPHWTMVGTINNSVWPDGGGSNRDGRVGFTLGVRYGSF
jgi:hypothetical protein